MAKAQKILPAPPPKKAAPRRRRRAFQSQIPEDYRDLFPANRTEEEDGRYALLMYRILERSRLLSDDHAALERLADGMESMSESSRIMRQVLVGIHEIVAGGTGTPKARPAVPSARVDFGPIDDESLLAEEDETGDAVELPPNAVQRRLPVLKRPGAENSPPDDSAGPSGVTAEDWIGVKNRVKNTVSDPEIADRILLHIRSETLRIGQLPSHLDKEITRLHNQFMGN